MVKFIAEVSSNHHQDLGRCINFIDTAADIGCYGVKFQLFKIEQLFAKEILDRSEEHRARKQWELPAEFLPELSKHCEQRNIKFGCTPFYLNAVDTLFPYVDFFKIASYELLWLDLIAKCAQSGKPIIISTGMADLCEIKAAVSTVNQYGDSEVSLLHCISGYPTPVEQCNLAAIETIAKEVNLSVGWSDHSVSPAVIYRAVHRWKADTIEFHLDLDKHGEEYKSGHCWLPAQMAEVISTINDGQIADGNGDKKPLPVEKEDRDWRADASDGLRPIMVIRQTWQSKQ